MTAFSEETHVFIVRVWQEPREIEEAAPEYRGSIEHLASGRKGYFRDPGTLLAFIQSYTLNWRNTHA